MYAWLQGKYVSTGQWKLDYGKFVRDIQKAESF